jgi:acyl-CoA thioester hydrolase
VRVSYEDTDFSGVVYHANYLRFMERGRSNYLRLLRADQRALFEQAAQEAPGFAFVVRSMRIDFRMPARMDDVLDVASVVLHQRVTRAGETLVEASVQVAFVSGGRARPIPKSLRAAMQADRAQARVSQRRSNSVTFGAKDINRQTRPARSVENDSERTSIAFAWERP